MIQFPRVILCPRKGHLWLIILKWFQLLGINWGLTQFMSIQLSSNWKKKPKYILYLSQFSAWFFPESRFTCRKKIYKKSIKTRTDSSKNGRLSIYRLKILSTIDHGGSNDTIIFLFFVLHETIVSSLLFAVFYRNNSRLQVK